MSNSLDRKIEAAKRRAAEERASQAPRHTIDSFNEDNHMPDGTVRPPVLPRGTSSGMTPKPQRVWGYGGLPDVWVDCNEERDAWYTTSDGKEPTDTLSNVKSIRTRKVVDPLDVEIDRPSGNFGQRADPAPYDNLTRAARLAMAALAMEPPAAFKIKVRTERGAAPDAEPGPAGAWPTSQR